MNPFDFATVDLIIELNERKHFVAHARPTAPIPLSTEQIVEELYERGYVARIKKYADRLGRWQFYKQGPGACDVDHSVMEPGWYAVADRFYEDGSPMPVGKSIGPFKTKRAAVQAAQGDRS